MEILSLGLAGGNDLGKDIDHVLEDQLLAVEVHVVGLLLDQDAAGGMLGVDNGCAVVDAALGNQSFDLIGHIVEGGSGIGLDGKGTMITGHWNSPLLFRIFGAGTVQGSMMPL